MLNPLRNRSIPALLLAAAGALAALAAPPRVVEVTPKDGDRDVDPALRFVTVKFDQDMIEGSHSWCGGGETFPKLRTPPIWIDARTCMLAVDLEPEHDYALSINCPAAQNFMNEQRQPAEPHPLRFRTGKDRGGERLAADIAAENDLSLRMLHRAIDRHYSYRDLHHVDWDALFKQHADELKQAKSAAEFGERVAKMLAAAQDIHMWVDAGDQRFGTHSRSIPPNCNLKTLRKVMPNWQKRGSRVASGRFDDGIGYILIASWSPQHKDSIEQAFAALDDLADCRAIIVDVRHNSGGDEGLAQNFAGCFIDIPCVYAKNRYRDPEDPDKLTDPIDRTLRPTKGRPRYRGRVAVLTGRYVMSSCEAFLLMMRQVPDCKLVGEASYGASGNPKPHPLPNGVTVYLPSWQALDAQGEPFEGKGIQPDIEVKTERKDFAERDPVLDAALEYLRK
jgi:hypothetical protein